VLNAELAIEVFELRNIQFKDVVARQNCMETANIINVIVIVMTDEKRRRRKSQIEKFTTKLSACMPVSQELTIDE